MEKQIIYLLALVSFLNCSGKQVKMENGIETKTQIEVIDLVGHLNKSTTEYLLSDAVVSFDVVPLEITDATLLGRISDVVVTSEDIFVYDVRAGICRFDRTGKFLNKIGKKGQGPGEYKAIYGIQVDENNYFVYLYDFVYNKVFKYDFDGKYINTVLDKTDEYIAGTNARIVLHHDRLFMMDILPALYERKSYPTFFLFDQSGKIKKTYFNPEYEKRAKEIWENRQLSYGWKNFWRESRPGMSFYNNSFLMSYYQSDTIYKFDDKTECFLPRFIMKLGDKPSFEESHQWVKEDSFFTYLWLSRFYETQKYLYFQLTKESVLYIMRYDKETKEIVSCAKETTIKRTNLPGSPGFVMKNVQWSFPFKNDFCGGIFDIEYECGGKYWVRSLTPEMIEEMDVEEIKQASVKDQALKDKYLKILKETKPDDNPILLIATLK